ncbi:MAG: endonuclease/exonuclease/phosphatase family protein [Bacteroidetes bacterium]|nr:endonuclease/exonuclease/phosphatase family protein [Bacteroidota bacterium]
MMLKHTRAFLLLLWFASVANAQTLDKNKHYYIAAVGFWNVENLYDTVNDPRKNDDAFTPQGINAWTGERYRTKIEHLAEVISQMATDATPDGLAVLGMCEVENKKVVQDLVKSPRLAKRNYQIVHIEGPDARGIDPSFIYNPNYFKVTNAVSYRVQMADSNYKTRDILVVSGLFTGEPLTVLVNHWSSRRGGELASRDSRNRAARVARHIADSVAVANPESKIIIMGDFNDDPIDESVKKIIGTYANIQQAKANNHNYFNPMENLYKDGTGTIAYRDSWNLFDQILLNKNLVPQRNEFDTWNYHTVRVFNKDFLRNDFGNYKGYPFSTYGGGIYNGGYSDHFPVYIIIAKEKSR